MTFNFAPWAIDGARTTAALGRLASYTTGGGRSGIAKPDSLKVLPLEVPGNGLRITSGGGTVLNHYLNDPDETYVVSNPGTHVVTSADMPAPVPQTAYYLVCVVVGDPEFDQTDHPFMTSSPIPPEDAADYEYVRIVIVPCAANTVQFEQLNLAYPAYALARLEVPPSTSTITGAMITDLRELAQPRQDRQILMNTAPANEGLGDGVYEIWPSWSPTVLVPPWATRASMVITLAGIVAIDGETHGYLRGVLGDVVGAGAGYDIQSEANGSRHSFVYGTHGSVAHLAGQIVQVQSQGYRVLGFGGSLQTWDGESVQVLIDIQFYEDAV